MISDPLAFTVPFVGIVVHTETVVSLVAIVAGLATLRQAASLRDWPVPTWSALVDVLFWAIVGGRLWYVATEWPFFVRYPLGILAVFDGGLAWPGLLLGTIWGARSLWLGASDGLWRWPVLLAPALAVASAIQWTGCALTDCLVGAPTDLPWGAEMLGQARHPLALYRVLLSAAAWLIARRRYPWPADRWVGLVALIGAEALALMLARLLAV